MSTETQQPKESKKTLVELSQEVQERIAVLKQKPEISAKVEYYKGMLELTGKFILAINTKVDKLSRVAGSEEDNSYEICKLEMEKLDAQTKLISQKQFFEMWLKRSKDYTLMFEAITQEANRDFDMILSKAQSISTDGSYLQKYIEHYLSEVVKDSDKSELEKQTLKNEFFLFMKYEVDKIEAPKKRFS